MATNTLNLSSSIVLPNLLVHIPTPCSLSIVPVRQSHGRCHEIIFNGVPPRLYFDKRSRKRRNMIGFVVQEGQNPILEEEETSSLLAAEQAVSVPVSPSDLLTMFFQAEGTMSETIIPSVTSALQETEGISNVHVRVVEGIASVELMKQTTIQATGVASNLIEIIQGLGFKLQTLNLGFEDEEEILVASYSNSCKKKSLA